MKKILMLSLFGLMFATSCTNLDIPPKNMVTDEELLTNAAGMKIFLSRAYSRLPLEEFKYMGQWGFRGNSWLGAFGIEGTGEALNRDGICKSFTGEDDAYWNSDPVVTKPFELLRDLNHMIETLPKYKNNFSEIEYNHYLGQAYFSRAFVFTAMAKRFGGIPLVTKEIPYPAKAETMEVPRSSEEETWDQILADYKQAAELLKPNLTPAEVGMANKYVALAYLSDAMLYAGSVAKYNETVSGRLTGFGEKTGVRVIGFDQNRSQDASKRYFTAAYEAARDVMLNGGYSLYKKKWVANDPTAQYQNMVDMFSDLSSPENIFVREYQYPLVTHGIDAYSSPISIWQAPLKGGTAPTLDFVELFDGLPRHPDGTIKVTDGNSNSTGEYLMFDKTMDLFATAEPRLRAYVILPGDVFKNAAIEVYAGVYTGTSYAPLLGNKYDFASAGSNSYQDLPIAKGDGVPKTLFMSANNTSTGMVSVPYNGGQIPATGADGPYYSENGSTLTGFYLRKWLNPDPGFVPDEGKSEQPFILMRYAEVMLNAAEAGMELSLAGAPSPDGSDMLQVATDAVNQIRERAGATLLTSNLTATEPGRNAVRKERRKELALEHKTKWDLRRWRVLHYEGRDGLWGEYKDKSTYGDTERYRFRGLYPFFSTQTGKFFFDVRFQWMAHKTFSYNIRDYYFGIPGGEVTKSPVIDQQPNR